MQLNEELKGAEIEGGCGKNLKLLINIFFAKRRKTVVEVIYQKKNRDHRTSKIAQKNPRQVVAVATSTITVHSRARCMTSRVNYARSKDAHKGKNKDTNKKRVLKNKPTADRNRQAILLILAQVRAKFKFVRPGLWFNESCHGKSQCNHGRQNRSLDFRARLFDETRRSKKDLKQN